MRKDLKLLLLFQTLFGHFKLSFPRTCGRGKEKGCKYRRGGEERKGGRKEERYKKRK
jgi:hypothetical protein